VTAAEESQGDEANHLPAWPVVARIWRTVDVERTVAELGLAAEPIPRDELLGGMGSLVRPSDGPPVAVLEPFTEGPLTASLARHGEGDAGVYVAPAGGLAEAQSAGLILTRVASGPFGRSAVVASSAGSPPGGPMRLVVIVEPPPATIEP
jgi:hypothetical protein